MEKIFMYLNKICKTAAILVTGICIVLMAGCADLSVDNLNEPDTRLALQNPEDVEALVIGGYDTWALMASWRTLLPHSVQADWGTGTVGNWWVNNGGHMPRESYPNTPTGPYPDVNEDFWEDFNGSLSNANIALTAIDAGLVIGSEGQTLGVKAAAQLLQGLSLGAMGLLFDQAFIVDENTNLDDADNINLQPYEDILAAAIEKLDAAKQTASQAASAGAANFPTGIIPPLGQIDERWSAVGETISWTDFEKIINSYAATLLVLGSRSEAENQQTNWDQVYQYASNGIDFDFAPISTSRTNWQSQLLKYFYQDWVRVNLNVVSLMDPDMPTDWPAEGAPLPNISDERYSETPDAADYTLSAAWSIFNPDRGAFKRSHVRYTRYAYHRFGIPTEGPIPFMLRAQNDLMLAEAEMRRSGGDRANAINLINRYHNGRGGLELSAGATDAEIFDTLYYEWQIEVAISGLLATPLFNNRRLGKLATGTMIHWPIPAKELGVLQLPFYSFGGGGEGSAPKIVDTNKVFGPVPLR